MATSETSPAHTPGPWTASADGFVFAAGQRVADANCDDQDMSEGETDANARLISAAPDLRQASQELYDRLQDYLEVSDEELRNSGSGGLVAAMDGMEAAWHKADGTTPEAEHGNAA